MNRVSIPTAVSLLASLALPACMSAPYSVSERTYNRPAMVCEMAPAAKASAFAPSCAPASGREVSGTSQVALEVADPETARAKIESAAESLGGYAEKNEPMRMVVRVPVARMKEAAAALAKIGRVLGGAWQAEDVTNEGTDLHAKIKALENETARLRALLGEAKDGEAQARLNAQLQNAERELALLTGAARQHDTKTALGTFDVRLQLDPALACLANDIPVAWVRALTSVLSQPRTVCLDYKPNFDTFSFGVELPAGFNKFRDRDCVLEAVDASSTHLRITRHDNPTEAATDFWFPLIRRGVAEAPNLRVTDEKNLTAAGKHPARLVVAERAVGEQTLAYAVATAVSDDHVYTVEMWGRQSDMAALRQKFETCVGTLRIR